MTQALPRTLHRWCAAVFTALLAACTGDPPPAEAPPPELGVTAQVVEHEPADLCADVIPEQTGPGWLVEPVSSEDVAEGAVSAEDGRVGVVVLEAVTPGSTARAYLDGVAVAEVGAGVASAAGVATLSADSVLRVETGSGLARASVAYIDEVPCELVSLRVERSRGPPNEASETFEVPAGALAVAVVRGAASSGWVKLDGETLAAAHPQA